MKKLAMNGGKKVRETLFPDCRTIGEEEEKAVKKVIESGILSKFIGAYGEAFYGGDEVRALEEEWADYFHVKHAISVNSATSGLICAIGAVGAGPSKEVIVSPYTMSASATSILIFNSIPVFADVEEQYFCLDVDAVEKQITDKTKAIVVVDLFGHPYDVERINALAKKHNLYVIEDAAQAPGARYKGKYAGTLGDIGVYSLNYHKHIHCGEGGIVVTDNDELAMKIRMIRNHAEAVVEKYKDIPLNNMIGFNFRMNEIEATIAREQLKKLDKLISVRRKNVEYIEKGIRHIPYLEMPKVGNGVEHAYYVHAIKFNEKIAGISREKYVKAISAELEPMKLRENEGVKISQGYVRPLYQLPIYQQMIGYGGESCPFKCPLYNGNIDYTKVCCSVAENLHQSELIIHEYIKAGLTREDLDDVIKAFIKVHVNINELK